MKILKVLGTILILLPLLLVTGILAVVGIALGLVLILPFMFLYTLATGDLIKITVGG